MPATIETDEDRTYFLMTIPCRHGFEDGTTVGSDSRNKVIDNELERIFGQVYSQVEGAVNQCTISNKEELGQILGQMYVQVWVKSRSKDNVLTLISDTINLLCVLKDTDLSANVLNRDMSFDSTKELKRKIILPLIEMGYVAMTYPDKPTSAKQTYRLTKRGQELFLT